MQDPSAKKKKWLLIAVLAGAAFMAFTAVSMARTSTTEYCLSCHEMKPNGDELAMSNHAVDKDKRKIECAQCHVPLNLGPRYMVVKTVVGMKDLVVHYLGDPEKLDRRVMQAAAKRFVPDENCLACHADLTKNVKNEPISQLGQLAHDAYLAKNGNTKSNCAGCHQNLAHLPGFDRHYDFRAEFAGKLAQKKAE